MRQIDDAARRLMTRRVPPTGLGSVAGAPFRPASFGVLDEGLLHYRMVDAQGRLLDLTLNGAVADALAACLALRQNLGNTAPPLTKRAE